jgi:hypothetical protein
VRSRGAYGVPAPLATTIRTPSAPTVTAPIASRSSTACRASVGSSYAVVSKDPGACWSSAAAIWSVPCAGPPSASGRSDAPDESEGTRKQSSITISTAGTPTSTARSLATGRSSRVVAVSVIGRPIE